MIAVVVILAIALAGSVSLNGALAYWWHDTATGERAAIAGEVLAERSADAAAAARDGALAAQKKAEAELAAALKQLADVEKERNQDDAKEADHVATEAESGDGAAALEVVNRELGVAAGELPKLAPAAGPGAAAAAAGADHGHAGQDAVHPAEPASSGGAGRSPAG